MYETNKYNDDFLITIPIPKGAIQKSKTTGEIYCIYKKKEHQLLECNSKKFLWRYYKKIFISYFLLIAIALILQSWLLVLFYLSIEVLIYYFFEYKKLKLSLKIVETISSFIMNFIVLQLFVLIGIFIFNFSWLYENNIISILFVINTSLYIRNIILYINMKFKKVYKMLSNSKEDNENKHFYIWKKII